MRKHTVSLICILTLLLLLLFPALARTRPRRTIPVGTWAGNHIRIEVAKGSATIEYDCATGTIKGPLTINSAGEFSLRGTYIREHAGPTRLGEQSNGQPARYKGSIHGKKMTLTVILSDTNEEVGAFDLEQGSQGRVFKCR